LKNYRRQARIFSNTLSREFVVYQTNLDGTFNEVFGIKTCKICKLYL